MKILRFLAIFLYIFHYMLLGLGIIFLGLKFIIGISVFFSLTMIIGWFIIMISMSLYIFIKMNR